MFRFWNFVDRRNVSLCDGVASMSVLIMASVLALWLTGCAQVGQFSAEDAGNAAAIATAAGDPAGAACWPILEATGNAISSVGDKPGILVAIEEKRAVQMALQNTQCQPVWAGVLAELLKATPAAPFVP